MSQLTFDASEEAAPLLSDFLLGLGSEGVAEDIKGNGIYTMTAYFPIEADLPWIMKEIGEFGAILEESVPGAKVGTLRAEHIDSSSWEAWKAVLKKIRVGKTIIIVPPWESHVPRGGETVIEINPSMAFGTGHHESTRLCIEAIEELAKGGGIRSMLDVGCGSGILAITASKLGIGKITAFDTDPVAIGESRKNAAKNSVLDKIDFFCGHIKSASGVYDLIVANVYLEPLLSMREDFKSRLAEGGRLVVSGIPRIRREEALEGFVRGGFVPDREFREGDWIALEFRAR